MNKYRCETCRLCTKDESGFDDSLFCTYAGGMTKISEPVIQFINVRGCASHSKIPAAISDEIWAYLDSDEGARWRHLPLNIRRKLMEFREREK